MNKYPTGIQSDPGQGGLGPLLNSDGFAYVTLALEHMPWWQETSFGTASSSAVQMAGGTATGLSVDRGDLSSRINVVELSSYTGTALDDVWIGIRPAYSGTAGFKSRWECELGVNVSDSGYGTASDVGDGAAINGTAVQCTFANNTTMGQRFRIGAWSVIGSATDDMAGRYLALGRLKCGTSTDSAIMAIPYHSGKKPAPGLRG